MLTQKEEKVSKEIESPQKKVEQTESKEINQIALQAQKDFQLLNTLFKKKQQLHVYFQLKNLNNFYG